MICLRCGHCCQNLWVVIIDDPAKGIVDDNMLEHNGLKSKCKHLRGDKPGEYSCAIHDEPWYPETPCAEYGQVERSNTHCRMGVLVIRKARGPDHSKAAEQELLDYLGISRSEINDFLAGSRERDLDIADDMHKLLIHCRIVCAEAGYPFSEACFGSIGEFIRADGSTSKHIQNYLR